MMMHSDRRGQAAGLCDRCDWHRWLDNDRGSRFLRCGLSDTDPRFSRFPTLPVLVCPGFTDKAGKLEPDRS